MRGFSTNISLLLHHHIRTHANIMTLDAVDTEYVTTVSMSTLITKLFRKNRILTICPLVSERTIGRHFCFPYTIWLKSRRKTQPLPVYVSAKCHLDIFHSKTRYRYWHLSYTEQ